MTWQIRCDLLDINKKLWSNIIDNITKNIIFIRNNYRSESIDVGVTNIHIRDDILPVLSALAKL